MSFDQLNNNLAKGDWDMLMDGWSTGPGPDVPAVHPDLRHACPRTTGTNGNTDAFFCNKQYDKLYEQQQTQFDAQAAGGDDRRRCRASCTPATRT